MEWDVLPEHLACNSRRMLTVLQSWVSELSFKNQTLLLSAIRGPDGVGKSNKVKDVLKYYRAAVLKEADVLSGFMSSERPTEEIVDKFVKDIEEYPLHWVMHFYRATAIVAIYNNEQPMFWQDLYVRLAKRLHLRPLESVQIRESI